MGEAGRSQLRRGRCNGFRGRGGHAGGAAGIPVNGLGGEASAAGDNLGGGGARRPGGGGGGLTEAIARQRSPTAPTGAGRSTARGPRRSLNAYCLLDDVAVRRGCGGKLDGSRRRRLYRSAPAKTGHRSDARLAMFRSQIGVQRTDERQRQWSPPIRSPVGSKSTDDRGDTVQHREPRFL